MNLNNLLSGLIINNCSHHKIGTFGWYNEINNLPEDIDGINIDADYSFKIQTGEKGFELGRYAGIFKGVTIKFNKCVGSEEIPVHDNIPMKLVILPPGKETPIYIQDTSGNVTVIGAPNSDFKKIELYTFDQNSIQLYEPLVLSAFPGNFTDGFWHIGVEFEEPFTTDYVVRITTNWLDLKPSHPLHLQLQNREFDSEYLEYTEHEIKRITL